MKNMYQQSKGIASQKTKDRKSKNGTIAWSGNKGTYVRVKHGIWDNEKKAFVKKEY